MFVVKGVVIGTVVVGIGVVGIVVAGMVLAGIGEVGIVVAGMVLVGIGEVEIVHEQFGEMVVVDVVAYLLVLFLVQGQDYLKTDAFFQIRQGFDLDLETFD